MDLVPALPKTNRVWKSRADFFRSSRSTAVEAGEHIPPLYDPKLHHAADADGEQPDLRNLNTALSALVEIFPDVGPEVFRDMLMGVSDESRVLIVAEQILKKGKARARRVLHSRRGKTEGTNGGTGGELTLEEMFRSEEYRKAVKQVFYLEFRNLSHSQIKTVMLEANSSYTLARPILQQLSARSWRLSIMNFWPKRSHQLFAGNDHPNIFWLPNPNMEGGVVPAVKRTGSAQLDHELHEIFVEPVIAKQRQGLLAADHAFAAQVNEAQAEEVGAVFDCECCYGSVPFEQLSTCDDECHQLCFDCVRRTVSEALYGQGWARVTDLKKSTVRCFSPVEQECHGCIPADMVRRALAGGSENEDTWHEFQTRVASEALLKCRVPLQRCPFCNYCEIAETIAPTLRSFNGIWHHLTQRSSAGLQILIITFLAALFLFTIPLILLASLTYLIVQTVPAADLLLTNSWTRVSRLRRGPKFTCRHPVCGKQSCIRCNALWRDPHTCFEHEKTSLRTAIESSATAAVKRTCPKCHLSFVKSSGCNKLVCNCGYIMCYICRQEIRSEVGYAHFCQHFRPSGGRCGECERCDLYGDEDEEAAIRRAAEGVERAWREREEGRGGVGGQGRLMVEALVGERRGEKWWERWVDGAVGVIFE